MSATFFAQLGSMVRAGLPLRDAVAHAGRAAGGRWAGDASRWAAGCAAGEALAPQLARDGVEPMAAALVGAGETSGRLPELCADLAAYYDHRRALRRLLLARLAYPVVLAHVALAAAGVPAVVKTWSPLPLLYGPAALWALVAVAVVTAVTLRRTGAAAHLALRWPLRGITLPLVAANTCLVLRGSAGAGMLHHRGLELAAGACGNRVAGARLAAVARDLATGRLPNLVTALRQAGLPESIVRLIETGEVGGTTEAALERATRLARESFEERTLWTARIAAGTCFAIAIAMAVIVIFSIAGQYVGMIESTARELE